MRGQCSSDAIQVSEIIKKGSGGGSGAAAMPDLAFYRAAFQQLGLSAEEAERLAAEAAASVSGTD
jgi:hypothetical protein